MHRLILLVVSWAVAVGTSLFLQAQEDHKTENVVFVMFDGVEGKERKDRHTSRLAFCATRSRVRFRVEFLLKTLSYSERSRSKYNLTR